MTLSCSCDSEYDWYFDIPNDYTTKISRCLSLQFSKETGKEKGSWKGGTVGHAIEMLPNEMHKSAFQRYCAQHEMKFIK